MHQYQDPGREALTHFLAAALTGMAITGVGGLLSVVAGLQRAASPGAAGYAALSLLIAAGMALFGYLKAHRRRITEEIAQALDQAQAASEPPAASPTGAATPRQ